MSLEFSPEAPTEGEDTDLLAGEPRPRFNIEPVIEQRSFEQAPVQAFFTEWFEANDSIRPVYMDREGWNARVAAGQMLSQQSGDDGKRELAIPTDLRLYEMVDVMMAVDGDTFADRPEKAAGYRDNITKLGEMFTDAGVYIAQRLDAIEDPGVPRDMAEHMADQFFNYGRSLVAGRAEEHVSIEDIETRPGPDTARLEEIDRWLAGDRLYEARRARALTASSGDTTKGPEASDQVDPMEQARRHTLDQFFRTSAKAFELQQRDHELKPAQGRKPWQSDRPVHAGFIEKVEGGIARQIETPKQELSSAVFRRGMDFLQKHMSTGTLPESVKDNLRHWEEGEPNLREALGVDRMRAELERCKAAGNIRAVGAKEREIADAIQAGVSVYKYEKEAAKPAEILLNEKLNCVGFSTLGGALMEEAGLNYLVADMPTHSALILVTSDEQLEWRDMQAPHLNRSLGDGEIRGVWSGDGEKLTVADVVEFSKQPSVGALSIEVPMGLYHTGAQLHRTIPRVNVLRPPHGQEVQVLAWVADALLEAGQLEAALSARKRSLSLYPNDPSSLSEVGALSYEMGRWDEAIEAYWKAIPTDTENMSNLINLALAFDASNRTDEAIAATSYF